MPLGASPPGRKPSVWAGRSGAFIVAFPACLGRVHLPPPDGAPVKPIKPLSSIPSPSPRLLFPSPPSLFSRLFPLNAFQAVSTIWGRGDSSATSEMPFFSGS
ncbi:unnamed protein product [Rangifer tarandus platyrhynchus]|uniref:Uncharacterized protein n=1 Tax=Rangifer tarandus platyrhynchus TaxID=3082113 RepID=A0ABN8YHM5_RANTA|nr:unnamed protein product [Rangifer tarandus platyrhynchus]